MLRADRVSLRVGEFDLRDISLEIAPSEYFVLMGPTGSGKSLFVKSICGLMRPDRGYIFIDGQNITDLEPRYRNIGYVPQHCALFPHMTVAKNITFALRLKGIRHATALEQLAALIEPLGLRPLLGRSVTNLSGGERQKVAVARALAVEPKLLVLDEPVSALDEPTRHEVCLELRTLQRSLHIPTIHICHSVVEARLVSDRVGVFVKGRLAQTGDLDTLTAHPANDAVARLLNVSTNHRNPS